MKSVANYISVGRIVLTLTLVWIKPLSIAFLTIYILCGISDVLDGYIARKTNTISEVGGKLDTLADLIMIVVLMSLLYPFISLPTPVFIWIGIIAIIKVISMMLVFIKFKTFEILHTYGSKLTGFMLFLFPLVYVATSSRVYMYIVCVVATLSSIEELFIHLLKDELETSKKSIFIK